ncbi:urease accessory protein UreF [Clostridium sp. SHJSY1]|uniref:urease accessory protein UreF n=1 Tax=Clostridium sp. SHJSY1 TaxID=2942483 RepID=UPI0028749188|nr:urease accessory protein UreF [Clostridium sp. SHJSY1]MDS0527457.1 urease accessory protein UreF [Clostridium sp. SHJSY1]
MDKFMLLQINDTLFPIGGYSHSYGLETYIEKGLVHDEKSVENYIISKISNSFLYSELLCAKLAYKYAEGNNIEKLIELEEIMEASRVPNEIKSANKKLGSRFKKTILAMDIKFNNHIFEEYVEKVKNPSYSCIYGVFCVSYNIEFKEALETYLYSQTSSMITTCVKSVPLSQMTGQKIMYRCHNIFRDILNKVENLDEDMLCASCPAFDIRSMQHENLYCRIYMS